MDEAFGHDGPPTRNVVSDALVVKCVKDAWAVIVSEEKTGADDELHPLECKEVDLDHLSSLSISFQNICVISNLTGFDTLTRLALDNNVLTEIVGIAHLVNLVWLDLSFNQITEIKGVESLVKLKDLTLFSNHISSIRGLDNCKELNCLSMGNNDIKEQESVMYLRRFPKLRMLNMKGNPLTEDPDYRYFTIAHLNNLQYLDYSLVELCELLQAKDLHQDSLVDLNEKDALTRTSTETGVGGFGVEGG